jgi:hypothetical protein
MKKLTIHYCPNIRQYQVGIPTVFKTNVSDLEEALTIVSRFQQNLIEGRQPVTF